MSRVSCGEIRKVGDLSPQVGSQTPAHERHDRCRLIRDSRREPWFVLSVRTALGQVHVPELETGPVAVPLFLKPLRELTSVQHLPLHLLACLGKSATQFRTGIFFVDRQHFKLIHVRYQLPADIGHVEALTLKTLEHLA